MNELISNSDAIVIGKVTDILPSQNGTLGQMDIIYTDVIVKPKHYLYGTPESESIAIRVLGGKIDNRVMWAEDQPEFTLGEQVLVFLARILSPPEPVLVGIDPSAHYRVVGSVQGKYRYWHGIIVRSDGFPVTCTWFVQMKISSIQSK